MCIVSPFARVIRNQTERSIWIHWTRIAGNYYRRQKELAMSTDSERNAYLFGGQGYAFYSVGVLDGLWKISIGCSLRGYLKGSFGCVTCPRGMFSNFELSELLNRKVYKLIC
jgi:hypothetical protein